jgi:hypothetical protein
MHVIIFSMQNCVQNLFDIKFFSSTWHLSMMPISSLIINHSDTSAFLHDMILAIILLLYMDSLTRITTLEISYKKFNSPRHLTSDPYK